MQEKISIELMNGRDESASGENDGAQLSSHGRSATFDDSLS